MKPNDKNISFFDTLMIYFCHFLTSSWTNSHIPYTILYPHFCVNLHIIMSI